MPEDLRRLNNAATIAQAVYSFFVNPQTAETALQEPGRGDFTTTEAARTLGSSVDPNINGPQGFELLDHQPNDSTGFSATVFYDRSSNKYVLGIRGSEQFTDYVEDVSRIGSQGFAGDQLVSLYRYYKKLTTPAGQHVQYSDSEVSMLQSIQLGIGTNVASRIFNVGRTATLRGLLAQDSGIVPTPGSGPSVLPPGAPLIVAGHSLGGHLALLFGRFFPDVTEHVYTYNAPGIGPQGELFLKAIGVPPSPSSLVTNVSAAMGTEAISKIPAKPGEIVAVATEPGDVFYQHNIVPLTDALALYGVFGTLSPGTSLDAAAVSGIISAASPFPEDSLEIVLDHLGKLLDTGDAPTPITRTNADLAQRDGYYGNLYDVLDSRAPGLDYEIEALAGKTAAQIASLAASDVSVRYALNELIPFYAKNADYSSFDGSVFSGAWLASRAEMLEGMLANNLIDRPFGFAGSEGGVIYRDVDTGAFFSSIDGLQSDTALQLYSSPSDRQALLAYLDGATYQRSVIFGSNSVAEGDFLVGLSAGDRLFGGVGDDHLDGQSGDDYLGGGTGDDVLLGGSGDDVLDGNEGADRLEGGAGNDSYIFTATLDADAIVDHDGAIFAGAEQLSGGIGGEDGNYLSSDDRFRYAFTGDLSTGGTLIVNESLRIEDFHNGDLGIRLTDSRRPDAPDMPVPEAVLPGDSFPERGDEYGNRFGIFGSDPDRADTYEDFQGTPGSTYFVMGGGDDVIQEMLGGDDVIDLGTGDDAGWGGTGDDVVEGGPGRDIVAGGRGNDTLYAGSVATLEADLDDAAVGMRPEGGDLLSGGDDDDTIFGDAERNFIEGGAGDDRIFGGAGDDWIGADVAVLAQKEVYQTNPPNNDWVNRVVDIIWPFRTDMFVFSLGATGGFGSPTIARFGRTNLNPFLLDHASGGNDEITAGAGNDTIAAGGGDDLIFGGDGDDYIDAGEGADTVFGGAGRDYILMDWDAVGDYADAGDGNDIVSAGDGDDVLVGGDGDDRLLGFGGRNILLGGEGNDFLSSTGDDSVLDGGAGNDMLFSLVSADGTSRVHVGRGSGVDVLEARGGTMVVDIAGDVSPGEVSLERTTHLIPARDGPAEFETLTGILVSIGTEGDAIFLADILPAGQQARRVIEFGNGTVWDNDHIEALLSSPGPTGESSAFAGTGGADLIYGSSGTDTFSSSSGNDWLLGDAGDDAYLYASGDGFDTIEDFDQTPGNTDVLRFADGIHAADVGVYATGGDYVLTADTGGVRLRGGRTQEGAIERVEFSDGSFWSQADLEARAELLPDNRAPSLPSSFGSVSVDPGTHVEVALPEDAISDPDRFDSVSLYAITAEGDKLPAWLHFDASSLSISGTPAEADTGVHELLIIAADTNGAAAFGSLTIAVGADIPVPAPQEMAPPVLEQAQAPVPVPVPTTAPADAPAPTPALNPPAPSVRETAVADAPALRADPAPLRRDDAFSELAAAPLPGREPPRIGEAADPAFREVQHSTDVLLQTGRTNLGERYAEAIREFEERRVEREREDAPPPPPPTDEEVEAWNAAMHDWHDRNPGFAETELGGNDGIWSMGWALPGPGQEALGGTVASLSLPGLANPIALARLPGAASAPTLGEGFRDVR